MLLTAHTGITSMDCMTSTELIMQENMDIYLDLTVTTDMATLIMLLLTMHTVTIIILVTLNMDFITAMLLHLHLPFILLQLVLTLEFYTSDELANNKMKKEKSHILKRKR